MDPPRIRRVKNMLAMIGNQDPPSSSWAAACVGMNDTDEQLEKSGEGKNIWTWNEQSRESNKIKEKWT